MSNRICANCGAAIEEGKRFCTQCGTPAPAQSSDESAVQPDAAAPVEPAVQPSPPPETPPSAAPTPPPAYTPPAYTPPQYTQAPPPPYPPSQQPYRAPANSDAPPAGSKYEPISMGGYIGIFFLMCIPIVGLILMIVWACGGCRKINKRNFARAALILTVIALILSLVLGAVFKNTFTKMLEDNGISTSDFLPASGKTGSDKDGLITSVFGGLLKGDDSSSSGDSGNTGDLGTLMDNVERINQEAKEQGDGWPSSLPEYPSGTVTEVTSYRSEVTDTTREDMLAYIETLRDEGYAYDDFYDFGFSEQDMLDFDGWWGTDGKLYLSLSFYDGVLTIDYTDELPDLDSVFN